MPILVVSQAVGGTTRPAGMTAAVLSDGRSANELGGLGAESSRISGRFLADLLSSFAAHERGTVRLCLAAARQTLKEEWQSVYGGTAREHLSHLGILEDLIERLGQSPAYVSPTARMADYCTTKLMEAALVGGAVEPDSRDLVLLDSVALAGTKCRDNREVLDRIARHLPPGHTRRMVDACVSQLRAEGDDYTRRAMEIRQAVLVDGVLNLHFSAGEIELGAGDPATTASG